MQSSEIRDVQQGSFLRAMMMGIFVMFVCAGLWAVITASILMQTSYMAIGLSFAVGVAMKMTANKPNIMLGLCSSLLSLIGCLLGNLLAMIALQSGTDFSLFMTLLQQLDTERVAMMFKHWFDVVDLVYYGLALYGGYVCATISDDEDIYESETVFEHD